MILPRHSEYARNDKLPIHTILTISPPPIRWIFWPAFSSALQSLCTLLLSLFYTSCQGREQEKYRPPALEPVYQTRLNMSTSASPALYLSILPCRSRRLAGSTYSTGHSLLCHRGDGLLFSVNSPECSGTERLPQRRRRRRQITVLSGGPVEGPAVVHDIGEEAGKEEGLLPDNATTSSRPRRIAIFVEPSPFAYVSGYKNRFQNFIRYLREMGDEVIVITNHEGIPEEFYGAKLIGSWSFPCPLYTKVPLSLALSPRIISEVARFKPDIIHASSPGIMVFGALVIAKLLCVPLVMSYHTHVPIYIPKYTFSWLVKPMWLIIKFLHRAADLTLVPSVAIRKDLEAARVTAANKIRLWNKGVDSDRFNPQFRSHEMRVKLTGGQPKRPLIVHVGRLGVEKSLDFLKKVMDRLPEATIAFVGDGPYREELEMMFSGMPAVFTGTLHGDELSQAYASGDVFVTPSESETLGFVVLEAMSSGLPVVAVRAGGIPDIIPEDQEGKTGFLYTPGDLDDCVNKLERLLGDQSLRETIGKEARKEMEKFDWRAATLKIRNEQYDAAIWFWRKKRAQLLRPIQWLAKRILRPDQVRYG